MSPGKFVSYIFFFFHFPLVTTKQIKKDFINIEIFLHTFILHFIHMTLHSNLASSWEALNLISKY